MCLTVFSWGEHPKYPLVLAANRDEFHRRPSAPMAWWEDGHTLAGRDLEAGGTWLGISRLGRIGLLTNVREPGVQASGAASRGVIVPTWLAPRQTASALRSSLADRRFNGFNLLAIDLTEDQAHWISNRHASDATLPAGLHGLSNAALNTPWPKLTRLKDGAARLIGRIAENEGPQVLLDGLIHLLTDRHQPTDDELPRTGVPIDWERRLGRIFIEMPETGYGTRCSTAIVVERRDGDRWRLHAVEQSWSPEGRATHRTTQCVEGMGLRPVSRANVSARR